MTLNKTLLAAAMGVSALALSAVGASAAIVCRENVCWHVTERHEYPADAQVKIYADDWKWGPQEKYEFREHEGRGYWHGNSWKTW